MGETEKQAYIITQCYPVPSITQGCMHHVSVGAVAGKYDAQLMEQFCVSQWGHL